MAAKPRQRKRPRAESGLGEAFDTWLASTTIKGKREETIAKATWVIAWNEGRDNAIAKEGNLAAVLREQEKLRAQLAEQTKQTNKWVQRWDQESNNYIRATVENGNLRVDLDAANSRIAELERELEAAQNDREARIARLTAEKDVLDADCAKIRGERDRAAELAGALREELALAKANAIEPEPKYSWTEKFALFMDGLLDKAFGRGGA